MSIEKIGLIAEGWTFWKMVPNLPGTNCHMSVDIVATDKGLQIGAGIISWADLDLARAEFTDG